MKRIMLASAAALAFTATPAIAQDTVAVDAEGNTYVLTDDQQVMYDAWPTDRQTAYDAWPAGIQEYYWTLDPAQGEGWWVLTDDQRVRIYEMTPEQRAQAWTAIASQMNGAPVTAPAGTTPVEAETTTVARTTSGTSPRFVRGEVAQNAPTRSNADGEYPPCKGDMTDGCVNPREAGLNYGNRPLQYWPGRPASEIDEPLPAEKPDEE